MSANAVSANAVSANGVSANAVSANAVSANAVHVAMLTGGEHLHCIINISQILV